MEDKKVLVEYDGIPAFKVNYNNPYTGKPERYVFPAYKAGSKRKRTMEITEECYYFLKDETSTFKEGILRIVTEEAPEPIKEEQVAYEQEVIDTTPEYEDNAITKEEIEKIMKGNKATMVKRLSKIESSMQKQYVVEMIKELKIKNIDKLREVVRLFYGEEMDVDFIFPPTDDAE